MPLHRLLVLAAAAAYSSGCTFGESGELGTGFFIYECGAVDFACVEDDAGTEFIETVLFPPDNEEVPQRIAVGAEFVMTFMHEERFFKSDSERSSAEAESGSPSMLSATESRFEALRPGFASVVARMPDGNALDFIHLKFEEIERVSVQAFALESFGPITFERETPANSTITIPVGHRARIQTAPGNAAGQVLGGGVDVQATIEDPEVAEVWLRDGFDFELEGLRNGETTLQITMEDHVQSVRVVVGNAQQPPRRTGNAGGGQ